MKFEDFIKEGNVRKASHDEALIKSLVKTAKIDLEFLDSLNVNEKSARKIMVGYYDVLRSILEAISSQNGYKIYSHEAFTFFLKKIGESVFSIKFDRFRRIRNSINYYGEYISIEETKENIKEIKEMISILTKKYLNKK